MLGVNGTRFCTLLVPLLGAGVPNGTIFGLELGVTLAVAGLAVAGLGVASVEVALPPAASIT